MTLAYGARLGPYEILGPLGAGGMGEVYRARDERLRRDVAIKILPEAFAADPERLARFQREAQVLASVNHPGIAAIYGFEETDGVRALVLEIVEGETLADRIARGALPLEEALDVAREIALALQAAHERGIVHRDLKPANVKLTPEGRVKVLDFGLAKALTGDGSSPDVTSSPTMTAAATQAGVVIGTAAYMSPEQARGKSVDRRGDIWSFGAVLYEMLAGRKAFEGDTVSDTLAAVLKTDPDWGRLPAGTPANVRGVLKRCLERDREKRLHDIADARLELEERAAPSEVVAASAAPMRRPAAWIPWALAALAAAALAFVLWSRPSLIPTAVLRSSILPPDGAELVSTAMFAGPVEISPDGTRIAFTARRGEGPNMLWVRALDESAAQPLAGTEGASRPFWSPDSRSIGFFSDRALRKIDANGGPVFTLATALESRGGTWNANGVILFSAAARGPIYRVSAEGGRVVPATALGAKDFTHRYPHFLPDGRHFLYLARRTSAGSGSGLTGVEPPAIMVASLDSKETRPVVSAASNVVFASGHLLYVREHALVAQPFDLRRVAVQGQPVTIVPGARMDERFSRGVFSASRDGLLVYQTGEGHTLSTLRWLDRSGKVLATVGEPAQFFNGGHPEISPDGTRAVSCIVDLRNGRSDIWMSDLVRGTRSRFTTGLSDNYPAVWSPDGRRIAHSASTPALPGNSVVVRSTDGSGTPEVVMPAGVWAAPQAFSPDGRYLLIQKRKDERDDLWAMPLSGDRTLLPVATTNALETLGQFTPDGRYLAYVSDESGRTEIYVTRFPEGGERWQVSQNGGTEPRWREDGKEIFFFAPDNFLMAAEVKWGGQGAFEIGAIQRLFQSRMMGLDYRYAVARDGQRFLVNCGLPEELSPISLVVNWTAALPK